MVTMVAEEAAPFSDVDVVGGVPLPRCLPVLLLLLLWKQL